MSIYDLGSAIPGFLAAAVIFISMYLVNMNESFPQNGCINIFLTVCSRITGINNVYILYSVGGLSLLFEGPHLDSIFQWSSLSFWKKFIVRKEKTVTSSSPTTSQSPLQTLLKGTNFIPFKTKKKNKLN